MQKRVKIYKVGFLNNPMKRGGCFIGCIFSDQIDLNSSFLNNFISKECSNSLVTSYSPIGNFREGD